MEVISIDGVDYVKASTAAKQFKYTADYIGQLCRNHKVDAKLIGRTWYVNPLSLATPKTARNKKVSPAEISNTEATEIKISRLEVNPTLSKKTAKAALIHPVHQNYAKRIGWKPLAYEEDTSDLLPTLKNPHTQSARINVDVADAVNVTVAAEGESVTDLAAEPLPTVTLTGTIRVNSLEEIFENNEENIAISEEETNYTAISHDQAVQPNFPHRRTSHRAPDPFLVRTEQVSSQAYGQRPVSLISTRTSAQSAEVKIATPTTPAVSHFPWLKLLALFLVAVVFSGLLFVLEVVITTHDNSTQKSFVFVLPTFLK